MNHPLRIAFCAYAGMLGAAPLASAAPPCTQQSTWGAWMYTCEGLLPGPPAGALTPTRILGTCSASRSAYWTCEGTVNLGGLIVSQGLVGQANNHANCTGTISYEQTLGGAPAGLLDIRYVVHDGADAISGLPVNPGVVLSCSLRRIGRGAD